MSIPTYYSYSFYEFPTKVTSIFMLLSGGILPKKGFTLQTPPIFKPTS